MQCGNCQSPLIGSYYRANATTLCEPCASGIQQLVAGKGSSAGRFFKAVFLGLGAAIVAAIGYGLWMGFTNIEFALITIAIGWLVGTAVRNGSGGRGGWRYGILAVALTYLAIAWSYFGAGVIQYGKGNLDTSSTAPTLSSKAPGVSNHSDSIGETPSSSGDSDTATTLSRTPKWLVILTLFIISFAAPVMSGMDSILSIVIIGFGLWQAWKMNQRLNIEIEGPIPVDGGAPA